MATLYKKPNSRFYYAQYFNSDGERVSKSTGKTSKRDANVIANNYEADERSITRKNGQLPPMFAVIVETAAREAAADELTLARAEDLVLRLHRLANPDFKVVSLDDHLKGWIAAQKPHVGLSTIGVYEDMRRRITDALGKKISSAPVGDLTAGQIRKALDKIKESGLKSSTVNMDLRALRRALHAAVTAGLAKANVAARESVRVMKEKDSTVRGPFTASEVRLMIDHGKTNDEWKGCILIAAHSGLRLGDVVSLTRSNVSGDRLVVTTEKTGKTVSIPITPPVMAWIGDKQGTFFPKLSKVVPGTLSTTFKRIMASAGVSQEIDLPGGVKARRSFHSLRHSFASWLAEADVHADVRQKLTGHSSSKIHARYSHHDEALDRAVENLPSL
jgi:integrase